MVVECRANKANEINNKLFLMQCIRTRSDIRSKKTWLICISYLSSTCRAFNQIGPASKGKFESNRSILVNDLIWKMWLAWLEALKPSERAQIWIMSFFSSKFCHRNLEPTEPKPKTEWPDWGEFSPIGLHIVYFGQCFENHESSPKFLPYILFPLMY
jgi:hypothetical protein